MYILLQFVLWRSIPSCIVRPIHVGRFDAWQIRAEIHIGASAVQYVESSIYFGLLPQPIYYSTEAYWRLTAPTSYPAHTYWGGVWHDLRSIYMTCREPRLVDGTTYIDLYLMASYCSPSIYWPPDAPIYWTGKCILHIVLSKVWKWLLITETAYKVLRSHVHVSCIRYMCRFTDATNVKRNGEGGEQGDPRRESQSRSTTHKSGSVAIYMKRYNTWRWGPTRLFSNVLSTLPSKGWSRVWLLSGGQWFLKQTVWW